MTLTAANAAAYQPTDEDRLWLLRATEAEGSPVDKVPRILVNLFMKQRAAGNKQSLTQLVRAYSQPVNPRWYPNGDLFKKQFPKPTAQQASVANARQNILSTRATFLPEVLTAVDTALTKSFASNATDYAAPTISATTATGQKRASDGMVALTAPAKGTNRLWSRDTKWGGYTADGDAGGGSNLGIALAMLGVAYAIWKSA